jgi:GT2 family glycosyltransferase
MANRPPSVSAVVATYGRREHLARFLGALLANRVLAEAVVVVDGGDDGSLELVDERARRDERLRGLLVDHQGQFGALDAGARAAAGDIVLFLDDDVIVDDDFVEGHARRHERPDLVVLGYMPPRLPPRAGARDFATVLYAREYEGRCRHYEHDPDSVLRHLWGGNFSLHRADYLALDPRTLAPPSTLADVRLYHQDRDFGLRCLEAGLVGRFDRSIAAVHEHRRDVDGFLRDAFGQGACRPLLERRHPDTIPAAPAPRGLRRAGRARGAHPATRRALAAAVASRSLRLATATARTTRRIEQERGAAAMAHHLSQAEQHSAEGVGAVA